MSANVFSLTAVNLPQHHIIAFANQSLYDRYDIHFGDDTLALLWGITNGIPYALGAIASLSANICAERFGRKLTLFVFTNIIGTISVLMCAASHPLNAFEMFFVGKLLFGISFGAAMHGFTLYNVEISPDHLRGLAGSFSGLVGILVINVAMVLSMPSVLGTAANWPYLYVFAAGMHLFGLVVGICLPESPRYTYLHKGNQARALKDLRLFHGTTCDYEKQFRDYQEEAKHCRPNGNDLKGALLTDSKLNEPNITVANLETDTSSLRHILCHHHLRMGLLIGLVATCGRAFCGIDNFLVFSTKLFSDAFHVPVSEIQYFILATSAVQVLPVVITPCLIDKFPRRKLYLVLILLGICCNSTLMVSLILFETYRQPWQSYIACGALLVFCVVYLLGITPIGFTLIAEITPQAIRAKCAYTILIITVIPSVAVFFILLKWMPETNGIPIATIVNNWVKH